MDYLIGIINNFTQDPAILRIIFISLTSITVMALALGVGFLIIGLLDPVRLRMAN